MANNLYITATEAGSGKSLISLGVMEMLLRKIKKVGFFRPIIETESDSDIDLISNYFKLDISYEHMYGLTVQEASDLIAAGKEKEALEGIIEKYNHMQGQYDFVLCEGTDFSSSLAAFEFDINAEISKNLGSSVLLVADAFQKNNKESVRSIELAIESLNNKKCNINSIIVNRLDLKNRDEITKLLKEKELTKDQLIYTIPDEEFLEKPTVGELAQQIGAEVLYGEDRLNLHVHNFVVAAMQLRDFLTRIKHDSLIITPGDRADVIVACLAAMSSKTPERISGILLTGGLIPEEPIRKLIEGFPKTVPILSIGSDTYPTATMVEKVHTKISPDDTLKIFCALSIFEENVDVQKLQENIITTKAPVVTPKMFEYDLLQKAKKHKRHIVLPEGEEDRILEASEILLQRGAADLTLLGNEEVIRQKIAHMRSKMDGIKIVDPMKSPEFDDYVKTYYELRKHKGITMENARDVISDVTFFGTMMVHKGHADGMVSGAVHSTAATVRPAFEIIKTKPGFSIVSSVFFMCLENDVFVYGDCAVNANPNANQLADIAISSAQTAKTFGVDPIVAMLSYSTGKSGKGEDVDKVREATDLAKAKAQEVYPDLKLDGPIQYDAAVDPSIAETKMPDSDVAGKATVFIFPDLNTGNNTYKAVQQTAGIIAIGPVLQGLNHPVNDLSRGCTIPDIVNTVVVTAIQAQSEKGLS